MQLARNFELWGHLCECSGSWDTETDLVVLQSLSVSGAAIGLFGNSGEHIDTARAVLVEAAAKLKARINARG